jgi:tetratricopeptide (TPR) repeat protein
MRRAVCEEQPKPAVRGELNEIVMMALRKDSAQRYTSVDQFSDDLRRFEKGYPVIAVADTVRYRAARFLRRNRLGMAAAGLGLVVMIGGMSATAWDAHIAKQRFQDVRRLANSVVFEYPEAAASLPGSRELKSRFVNDGLQYLDSLSRQVRRDSGLQLELAGGYLKIGDAQARANPWDTKGGLASYRKAVAMLEELQRREPTNEAAIEELAIAYGHLGELQQQWGDARGSVANLRRGIALFENLCSTGQYKSKVRLWNDAPDDRRTWLAPMYGELGRALGDLGSAEPMYRKELATYEGMGRSPKVLVSVASTHSRLGAMFSRAGKDREALAEFKKALDIDLEAAQTRPDAAIRREIAIAYHNVAVGYLGTKQYPEALENFGNAAARLGILASANPNDVNLKLSLADNLRRTGETQFRLKQYGPAIVALQKAIDEYGAAEEKNRMGVAYLLLSQVHTERVDAPPAVDAAQRAAKIFQELGEGNKSARQNLARSYYQLGAGYAAGGDWAIARNWYQKSVDLWHAIQPKDDNSTGRADAEKALAEALRRPGGTVRDLF